MKFFGFREACQNIVLSGLMRCKSTTGRGSPANDNAACPRPRFFHVANTIFFAPSLFLRLAVAVEGQSVLRGKTCELYPASLRGTASASPISGEQTTATLRTRRGY